MSVRVAVDEGLGSRPSSGGSDHFGHGVGELLVAPRFACAVRGNEKEGGGPGGRRGGSSLLYRTEERLYSRSPGRWLTGGCRCSIEHRANHVGDRPCCLVGGNRSVSDPLRSLLAFRTAAFPGGMANFCFFCRR